MTVQITIPLVHSHVLHQIAKDFIYSAGRRDEFPAIYAQMLEADYSQLWDLVNEITCETMMIQLVGLEGGYG
jgi:hypothetical protein